MTYLELQHAMAGVFFAVLFLFEVALARGLRVPAPFLWRFALLLAYAAATRVDPFAGLEVTIVGVAVSGLVLAVFLPFLAASATTLAALGERWRSQPAAFVGDVLYAYVAVALVEEVIFRGSFLLPAAVTPAGTVFGLIGSTVANVIWLVPRYVREGRPLARSLLAATVFALLLGAVTALTRSLWPVIVIHGSSGLLSLQRLEPEPAR